MADFEIDGAVMGYEEITVGTAVATLTAGSLSPSGSQPPRAAFVSIRATDGGVNFRCDGGAPGSPSGEGHFLGDGSSVYVSDINNLKRFQAIRTGTVDAAMMVSYIVKF